MTAPQRRSAQARRAILEAALAICRESGYAALTIEGVAARAGVGKQTIYRWWPSKGTVVLEAFMDVFGPAVEAPLDGADLGGLTEMLRRTAELLSHPTLGPMLADLVGAKQHDKALAAEFRAQIFAPIRAGTAERIRRAQDAGEIRPELDPDLVADLLFGPLWFRLLVLGSAPEPDYADTAVRSLLAGLAPAP